MKLRTRKKRESRDNYEWYRGAQRQKGHHLRWEDEVVLARLLGFEDPERLPDWW